jgi:hypothetical protein
VPCRPGPVAVGRADEHPVQALRGLVRERRPDRPRDRRPTDPSKSRLWPGIRLNVADATLININFQGGVVADSDFRRATFTGNEIMLDTTIFTGDALFDGATFTGNASFMKTAFTGEAGSAGRPSPVTPTSAGQLSEATRIVCLSTSQSSHGQILDMSGRRDGASGRSTTADIPSYTRRTPVVLDRPGHYAQARSNGSVCQDETR